MYEGLQSQGAKTAQGTLQNGNAESSAKLGAAVVRAGESIQQDAERMEKALDELYSELLQLGQRIKPVARAAPAMNSSVGAPIGDRSPVGCMNETNLRRLIAITSEVRQVRELLEV